MCVCYKVCNNTQYLGILFLVTYIFFLCFFSVFLFIYSHSHSDCFPVSQTVPVPQTQTRLFSGSPDSNQTVFWFPRFEPACFPVPQTGTRLFSGSPDWNQTVFRFPRLEPLKPQPGFPSASRCKDARMQKCKDTKCKMSLAFNHLRLQLPQNCKTLQPAQDTVA